MAIEDLKVKRTLELVSERPPLPDRYRRIEMFNGTHWRLTAEFPDERKIPGTAQRVIIELFAGIFPREQREVDQLASKMLRGDKKLKGARPPISRETMDILRYAIKTAGLPSHTQKQADVVRAITEFMSANKRPVSYSMAQKTYRSWLDKQMHPKKKYLLARDDRR